MREKRVLNLFTFLSVEFTVIGYGLYWDDILRGLQPKKASWLIWMSVDAILFFAMLIQNRLSLQILAYLGGSAVIASYAFFRGESGWTREDKIVLACAALALGLWFFAGPNAAIVLSMTACIIGTIPTWHRLWSNPKSEPFWSWFIFWIGGIFGVLAVGPVSGWTIASAFGPVGFGILQVIVIALMIPIRPQRRIEI